MKPILAFVFVGAFVAGLTGCAQEQAKDRETATIQVKGVQCNMCVAKIEEAVGNLDGVQSVIVDLDEKLATVEYIPAKLNQSLIEAAIAGIGYDANNTKRNEEAYEQLPRCCQ